jgi:hypothetical protein
VAELDRRLHAAAARGTLHGWVIGQYLRHTGRGAFPEARGFIESGLAQAGTGTQTADIYLTAALQLLQRPDKPWLDWARERYRFSQQVLDSIDRTYR